MYSAEEKGRSERDPYNMYEEVPKGGQVNWDTRQIILTIEDLHRSVATTDHNSNCIQRNNKLKKR